VEIISPGLLMAPAPAVSNAYAADGFAALAAKIKRFVLLFHF
jgi:hypothetical protein